MIERRYGNIVFICDECETAEFETDTSNFQDALDDFKNDKEGEKWVIHNADGDWKHVCPECSQII